MKKILLSIVFLINCLTLSANAAVVKRNTSDITSTKEEKHISKEKIQSVEYLTKVASKINKKLPKTINKFIRLNNVQAFQAKLVFNYTLKRFDKLHISADKIATFLKPANIQDVCPISDGKFLVDFGVDFKFNYFKENGKFISSLTVTSQDCKNRKK